ncbi:unnamed protein product [Phaedon cochleariae]|uniref:Ileal sodium/bile acid cotransporter n=1 Tax=Phaedon cochleariae TaxID=80249 RepID=A0A9N9X2T1_PHACE|nr:unnamed protein product [Phaedon cochleariae]
MNQSVRLAVFLLICKVICAETQIISFDASVLTIFIDETIAVGYNLSKENIENEDYIIYSENESVAKVENDTRNGTKGIFELTGIFLGKTSIYCENVRTKENISSSLEVTVIRKEKIIDTLFIASVATLVSLSYINFGCAMDWAELKNILKNPIGPAIGFFGQFIMMPLLTYGLGLVLFPSNPAMQLGMFFTGCSPGGGASNLWTLLLGGNIDLSIVMSAVSTIAAFAMMPLWIFTLGRTIFESGNLEVPYTQIMSYVVGLLVPLGVGYLIQRYLRRVSNFLVRAMKVFSTVLLVFIVVFAIVANFWLFKLFSYEIIIAGMAVPWIGYLIGFSISKLLRRTGPDCTAISIEIGIQNTGIAIFLLRFTLPQPEADLTTVVPVSIAILTPFPLLFLLICNKIRERCWKAETQLEDKNSPTGSTVSTLKL